MTVCCRSGLTIIIIFLIFTARLNEVGSAGVEALEFAWVFLFFFLGVFVGGFLLLSLWIITHH